MRSKITKLSTAALLALSGLGITAAASAQHAGGARQVQAPDGEALAHAIAAAESETGGTAVQTSWDEDVSVGMIEVELAMPDGSNVETLFNPDDGSVRVVAMDDDELTDENDNDRNGDSDDDDR